MTNRRGVGAVIRSGTVSRCSTGHVRGRTETPRGSSARARMASMRLNNMARRVTVALLRGQAGQSMVEYAIVLFLVAVVAMVAVRLLGQGVDEVFRSILASFRTVLPQGGGS